MQLIRTHARSRQTRGCHKVLTRINTHRVEHGKQYTYLEHYCYVMPRVQTFEDGGRQEAWFRKRDAQIRAIYYIDRRRGPNPYQGHDTANRRYSRDIQRSKSK